MVPPALRFIRPGISQRSPLGSTVSSEVSRAAVTEAGSLDQGAVVAALDHAKLAASPGGPAEMVPGQHHVRMNMYIAQVRDGTLEVVESLGTVDPHEQRQAVA